MSTILTEIHGRKIGIDSDGYVTAETGFRAPTIQVGVSGSEVTVLSSAGGTIADVVNAASTAANITFAGVVTLSSATKAYTMALPTKGRSVRIIATSSSTGNRTVEFASGATYIGGSNDKLTFTTANSQVAHLTAVSSAKVAVISKSTTVTLGT